MGFEVRLRSAQDRVAGTRVRGRANALAKFYLLATIIESCYMPSHSLFGLELIFRVDIRPSGLLDALHGAGCDHSG